MSWQGSASDAFQQTTARFAPAVADYVTHLNDAAASLDTIAAAIEEAHVQSENFKIMLGITIGVGIALTLFSFGTSDAAALAAGDTFLEALFARLAALFSGKTEEFAALIQAIKTTAIRMGYGAGLNLVAEGVVKGLSGANIFDPASYTAKDYTNFLMATSLTGMLGALGATKTVGGWLADHPILGVGAAGGVAGGVFSAIGQVWLNGNASWSPEALKSIALSTVFPALTGLGLGAFGAGWTRLMAARAGAKPPARLPIEPTPPIAKSAPALTSGDLWRGLSGIPADAAEFFFTIGDQEQQQAAQQQLHVPQPSAVPDLPPPPQNAVVAGGEPLWSIAEREYGDGSKYPAIAAANNINNPDQVDPDQDLVMPPVPQQTS